MNASEKQTKKCRYVALINYSHEPFLIFFESPVIPISAKVASAI